MMNRKRILAIIGGIGIALFVFFGTRFVAYKTDNSLFQNEVRASGSVQWGINIDPANPDGHPSAASLGNAGWVRVEFKDCSDTDPVGATTISQYTNVLSEYHNAGMKVLLILDYLSYPNAADNIDKFAKRVEHVAEKLGHDLNYIDAYEIWNEEDLASIYPLDTATYASVLSALSSAIRAKDPGKPIVMGGLASGQPSYVSSVKNALGGNLDAVDAIGVHPYTKDVDGYPGGGTGDIIELIDQYRAVADNKPIWITEMGLDTTDEAQQANYILKLDQELNKPSNAGHVPVVTWFAWSDGMVSPFGIVKDYSIAKASYNSYFNVLGVSIPTVRAQSSVSDISPEGGTSCGGAPENPGLTAKEGYIHPGIDIRPQRGVASSSYVYSTHAGFVTYAGPAPVSIKERGWMVQIESDLNRDNVPDVITRYTHMMPNSLRINDVWYRRFAFTPEYFVSLINGMDGIEKLPFGYGPYVARNQLLGMVGDSGSPGHVHIQYEILTNRFRSLYGLGLDTDVPYACSDSPYVEACSPDAGRPGFFFPQNSRKPARVRGPVYSNAGFVTPPPALTPIVITPTPAPATPTPDPNLPTPTPGPTATPGPTPPVGPGCADFDCFTMCASVDASNTLYVELFWNFHDPSTNPGACYCGDLSDHEIRINGVSFGRPAELNVISAALPHRVWTNGGHSVGDQVCRYKGNYVAVPGWDDACRQQNDWAQCVNAVAR